jgi:5-methylcytosine-specific restriction endonuclease McrA
MFGRNAACYKFALAKSLMTLSPAPGDLISLEDLATPYSWSICQHLKRADRQGTASRSRFLDACREFNRGEINETVLVDRTLQFGFDEVIDAFHVVGGKTVPEVFFEDERKGHKAIRIRDGFAAISGGESKSVLEGEVEARWRLVETAWGMGLNSDILTIGHDRRTGQFIAGIGQAETRRNAVTGVREALSGYQKGVCFYCFRPFTGLSGQEIAIDHFLPFALSVKNPGTRLAAVVDRVWNLVLACPSCNSSKSDRLAASVHLERLHTRNEFLITSAHPLRETLMRQTGNRETDRRRFLAQGYQEAIDCLLHFEWNPREPLPAIF